MTAISKKKSELEIRLFRPEDLPALALQHVTAFPADKIYSHEDIKRILGKKFFKNPAGEAIGAVAYDGSKLIGSYFFMPVRFKIQDNQHTFYHGTETFVHPEYRRQGLATRLFSFLVQEMKKRKVNLVLFGSPPAVSEKLHLSFVSRLGGEQQNFPLYLWEISLTPLSRFPKFVQHAFAPFNFILKKASHPDEKTASSKQWPEITVRCVREIPRDYTEFWGHVQRDYTNLIVRDSGFLQWRYFDNPQCYDFFEARCGQALVGYFVLLHCDETVNLIDLFYTGQKEIGESLMGAVLEHARESGAQTFRFWNCLKKIFHTAEKQKPRLKKEAALFFGSHAGENSDLLKKISNPEDWYLGLDIGQMG